MSQVPFSKVLNTHLVRTFLTFYVAGRSAAYENQALKLSYCQTVILFRYHATQIASVTSQRDFFLQAMYYHRI